MDTDLSSVQAARCLKAGEARPGPSLIWGSWPHLGSHALGGYVRGRQEGWSRPRRILGLEAAGLAPFPSYVTSGRSLKFL